MSQREKETAHLGLVSRDAGCWLSCPVMLPSFFFCLSVRSVHSSHCRDRGFPTLLGLHLGSDYHPLNCWIQF